MSKSKEAFAHFGLALALTAGVSAGVESTNMHQASARIAAIEAPARPSALAVQSTRAEASAEATPSHLKYRNYNPSVVKLARSIIARSVIPLRNVPPNTNGYTTFNRYGDVFSYRMHSTRGIHSARGVDLVGIQAITAGGQATIDLELARSPKTGRWNTYCSDTAQYGTSIASEIEQTYDSADYFPNVTAAELMLKEAIREDGHFIIDRGNTPAGVLPYAGWRASTFTCDALQGAAGEGNYITTAARS